MLLCFLVLLPYIAYILSHLLSLHCIHLSNSFLLTTLPKLTPWVGASHCRATESCRDFIQILLLPQGNPGVIALLSGPFSYSHRWHATHQTLPLARKTTCKSCLDNTQG